MVERGSEYILAHTGPRELDGHPLGGLSGHPPRGRPSNSLGPVWANMYSDPLSTTTTVNISRPRSLCIRLTPHPAM